MKINLTQEDICTDCPRLKTANGKPAMKILDEKLAERLSELFKVFGDPTRIKILHSLSTSERCVCEISDLLGMNQSAVSHQLKILKLTRLVKSRKEGKTVYYSLCDDHVHDIFACGAAHVNEKERD